MSLYREPGRRRILPLAIGGALLVLVGGLVGYLIGSSDDEQPSLGDAISEVQADVRPALDRLELVRIEYAQSVRNGQVIAATEYQASVDHAARARTALDDASADLRLLSPAGLAAARSALDNVDALTRSKAPPSEVDAAAAEAAAAIRAAARLQGEGTAVPHT